MKKYSVRPKVKKLPVFSYFRTNNFHVSRAEAYMQTGENFYPTADEYQQRVMELISSEQTYLKNLQLTDELFLRPLKRSNILSNEECNSLFLNLHELIQKSEELVKAFRNRRGMEKNCSSWLVGDILCQHIPNFHPYMRFCNGQLHAFSLLQEKLATYQEFKTFVNDCERRNVFKGLPVCSYLIKPMQRITQYPLLIEKIIQNTSEGHPDRDNLTKALEKAKLLCTGVNEGLRWKEVVKARSFS